nr:TadE family type IV pilus minor pilin [Rothia santali]
MGAATAEFAVLLPCIVLLLAVVLGAGACGAAAVRAEEAARLGARAAARGDSPETVHRVAREVSGERAVVTVEARGGQTVVEVRSAAPGVIGAWGGLEITADAVVESEAGPEAEGRGHREDRGDPGP